MTDVNVEYDTARSAAASIEGAESDRDAMVHAFNGISNLLLAILFEVRELNERDAERNA